MNMVYFFIADGFEEIEALCPLDLLRRVGIEVRTVGVGGREITGSHGITVKTDMTDAEYRDDAPELVFLPGGMPGTLNLAANETVRGAIETAYENGAYVASICAAPMILGEMGILRGREAICYPGFEDKLIGARISEKRTVADGNVLTAAGMGVSLDFGLLIIEKLRDKETAQKLRGAVIAD